MRWPSHQIITTTAVLAATGNPTMAVLAGAMSPLPDKIDQICGAYGSGPIKVFSHRKHSHYWVYWTILAVAAFGFAKQHGVFLANYGEYIDVLRLVATGGDYRWGLTVLMANLVFWGAIGSLLHIFEDFFSGMGVPLVYPHKISRHIKLYKTGSWSEYVLTVGSSFLFLWLYLEQKSPLPDAIRERLPELLR